ncbi:MAG: hypothetical protein ACTSSF_09255, partial [Candidatus Heimdallarchaeaceae archaeon]
IGFKDLEKHKIFRKTVDRQGKEWFLEIEFIPIINENGELEKYVEVIQEVDLISKGRVMTIQDKESIFSQIQVAIIQFGDLGAEILSADNLLFMEKEDLEEFLVKITVYIFSGLVQGFENQEGLFGPLPVLDKIAYETLIYVFRIKNEDAKDIRKNKLEPCMLYIFYPREYKFLFVKREEIEEFIRKRVLSWGDIKNINEKNQEVFVKDLISFLKMGI